LDSNGYEQDKWYHVLREVDKIAREKRTRRQGRRKTPKELLILAMGGKCVNCGSAVLEDLQPDHIVPLAMDGPDDVRNMQVLCFRCHSEKTRLDMEKIALYRIAKKRKTASTSRFTEADWRSLVSAVELIVGYNEETRNAAYFHLDKTLQRTVVTPKSLRRRGRIRIWLKRLRDSLPPDEP